MKAANFIFFILFCLFALLQLNDPDPYAWVVAYSYMSLLFLLAYLEKLNLVLITLGWVAFGIAMGMYFPSFLVYLRSGNPGEIIESMQAEKPYIEETRELLGLFINILALAFLWFQHRKAKNG